MLVFNKRYKLIRYLVKSNLIVTVLMITRRRHVLRLCRAPEHTLVSRARDKDTSALYIASSLLVYYSKNEAYSLDITSPECLCHIITDPLKSLRVFQPLAFGQ